MTSTRFSKPIRKKMWTSSQAIQAGKPDRCRARISATAAARPIVAMLPRSK
jgi:hypothetical protein